MTGPKLIQPEVAISSLQEGERFALVREGWGVSFPTRYGKIKEHGLGRTLVYWQDKGDGYVASTTMVNRLAVEKPKKPKTKKKK